MFVIQLQLATREDGNGPAKHQHSLGRMENGRWEAVDDERQENMRVAQTCGRCLWAMLADCLFGNWAWNLQVSGLGGISIYVMPPGRKAAELSER